MRRAKSIVIDIQATGVDEVVRSLEAAPEKIAGVLVSAINKVATDQVEHVRRVTVSQLDLSAAYVEDHVAIERLADDRRLEAVVTAPRRGTVLTRFQSTVQKSVPNNWTKAKYIAKFGSETAAVRLKNGFAGPWTERRGDPKRGIQPGQKQSGVFVRVAKSSGGNTIQRAFLLKLQNAAGYGVFRRDKVTGQKEHLYGPSLDQVAARVWRDEAEGIASDIGAYALEVLERELKEFG